jgi:hypothetical protein
VKTVLVEAAGVTVEVDVVVVIVTAMDGIVEVTPIVMVVLSTSRTLSKRCVSCTYLMRMGKKTYINIIRKGSGCACSTDSSRNSGSRTDSKHG